MGNQTKPKRYTYPKYKGTIGVSEFRRLPKDAKIDVMRTWFFERFEDPVHSTPWSEGEYVYIHGGPYDAEEELAEEFHGLATEESIKELASELFNECSDWTRTTTIDDYDDYDDEYEWIRAISDKEAFYAFEQSVKETLALLKVKDTPEQHFLRLLYVNAITALETYLSDFFINIIKSERGYLQIFVEKYEPFEKEKFPLNQIFSKMSLIEKTAITTLREIMWHNLYKVSVIYRLTLDIEFPKIPELYKAVDIRHDLVHRSGKTLDGQKHELEIVQIENVLNQAAALVKSIEYQWQEKFKIRDAEIEKLLSS